MRLPRMYPFSLTDCSVGRFMRNFISLVRTLFGSVSPAELDECVTLCLVAEKFQTFIDTLIVFPKLGQNWWRQPCNLHRRLSAALPNRSSRAASVEGIFSYKSLSSSSEGWSWYSWSAVKPSINTINISLQVVTGISAYLTSCRMVSVRTRCQSTMMLSVSYCIRNSTPFRVFNWEGGRRRCSSSSSGRKWNIWWPTNL